MSSTLFDYAEGLKRKEEGMEVAAENRAELLALAKAIAIQCAERNAFRECTMDDVTEELHRRGMPLLGNAAGSVFRGNAWRFTGKFVNSKRPARHANPNRVWLYCGPH